MEYESKDIDVVQLLRKLKDSSGVYPQEMLASRRQGYLRQVAGISGAAGLAMGMRNTVRSGGGSGAAPAAGTLVEALLVIAIIAEAGAVGYFYREKIVDFFQSFSNSPKVEVVTEAPEVASPIPTLDFTATPVVTATQTITETPTLVGTPTAEPAGQATQQSEDGSGSTPGGNTNSSLSTPNPDNNNTNTNNGNHYGLTPKPERTREPGNDNNEEQQESNPSGSNKNKR